MCSSDLAVTGADVGVGTWVGMLGAGVEVGRAASERGSPGRVDGAGEGEGRVGAGGLGCGETKHRSHIISTVCFHNCC